MKNTIYALLIIASTLLVAGCSCGMTNGCCANTATYATSNCCGTNNGW